MVIGPEIPASKLQGVEYSKNKHAAKFKQSCISEGRSNDVWH